MILHFQAMTLHSFFVKLQFGIIFIELFLGFAFLFIIFDAIRAQNVLSVKKEIAV